jgi:hypothetical protein
MRPQRIPGKKESSETGQLECKDSPDVAQRQIEENRERVD